MKVVGFFLRRIKNVWFPFLYTLLDWIGSMVFVGKHVHWGSTFLSELLKMVIFYWYFIHVFNNSFVFSLDIAMLIFYHFFLMVLSLWRWSKWIIIRSSKGHSFMIRIHLTLKNINKGTFPMYFSIMLLPRL